MKNPSLLLVFGLGIVLQLSFTGIWTYLPFHLTAAPFSLSLETIAYTFFAYGLGIIGSPVAGWLAGKFGLRKIRIAGVFVLSIGIILTISASFAVIVVGLCVTCLGFFTAHSLTAGICEQRCNTSQRECFKLISRILLYRCCGWEYVTWSVMGSGRLERTRFVYGDSTYSLSWFDNA